MVQIQNKTHSKFKIFLFIENTALKKKKENVTGMQVKTEDGEMVALGETNLDAEMAAMEAEGEMLVEEIERQRSEKKSSNVWIVIIGVLIVGIFATGIISTVKSGGKQKQE